MGLEGRRSAGSIYLIQTKSRSLFGPALLRSTSADDANSLDGRFLASTWAVRTLEYSEQQPLSFNSHGGGPLFVHTLLL